MNKVNFIIEPNIDSAVVADSVFTKTLTDAEIFNDLIRNNIIFEKSNIIKNGDIVRVDVFCEGEPIFTDSQFVMGKDYFPAELQKDIINHYVDETVNSFYNQKAVTIFIKSAKTIVRRDIDNELVKLACVDGVNTLQGYREYFLNTNIDIIRKKIAKQYAPSIVSQIVNNTKVEFDENMVDELFECQKVFLFKRSYRGNKEKYLEGLEQAFKNKTTEKTQEAFENCYRDMIRQQYVNSLVGKWFADKNGYNVSNDEYDEYCCALSKNYGTMIEEIKQEMTKAVFDKRKYSEYLQNLVIEHYSQRVKVNLENID